MKSCLIFICEKNVLVSAPFILLSSSSLSILTFSEVFTRVTLRSEILTLAESGNNRSCFYDGGSEHGRRTFIKIGRETKEVYPSVRGALLTTLSTVPCIPDSSPIPVSLSLRFAPSDFTIAECDLYARIRFFLRSFRTFRSSKPLCDRAIYRDTGYKILH